MEHFIRTYSISVQHIVTAYGATFESLQKVLPPDNLQVQAKHQKERNWHWRIFAGKHCEAQSDSGGGKGGKLHVLHSYLLSQARLTSSNLDDMFDILYFISKMCLTRFICLICLILFTCSVLSIWLQGGFVTNMAGFLLSRVQLIRCVGRFMVRDHVNK